MSETKVDPRELGLTGPVPLASRLNRKVVMAAVASFWTAPTLEATTLTFQQGVNGYSGAVDATLKERAPDTPAGSGAWSE